MSTETMHLLTYTCTHIHVVYVNVQLSASFHNLKDNIHNWDRMTKWDQHRHPALVLLFWGFPQFITHNLLPILLQKPKADTTPALHLLVIRFCWPLYSLSFNFLSSTSYLIPAYQNEVRDDCVHWLCLSAWVIHGNGKVQTGAVGGQGFLLFSLLDAFFLKSLTRPKL